MEDIDSLLSELGRSDPFPIDWQEYETSLLRRLARAETRRRRRAWGFSLIGAAAGVAATLLIVFATAKNVPAVAPTVTVARVDCPPCDKNVPAQGTSESYYHPVGKGFIRAVIEDKAHISPPTPDALPFVQKSGSGEIRFKGFGSEKNAEAGFIVVTKPSRKSKAN